MHLIFLVGIVQLSLKLLMLSQGMLRLESPYLVPLCASNPCICSAELSFLLRLCARLYGVEQYGSSSYANLFLCRL